MAWNDALIRLQEIDSELSTARQHLEEILAAIEDDAALRRAQQHDQKATAEAEAAQKAQKELEFSLAAIETERKETEARLYGGEVRNSRQLEDLQAKVQSLKRQKGRVEDQLLEAMVTYEEAQAKAEIATAALQTTTEDWEKTHTRLLAEKEAVEQRIADLETAGDKAQASIPPQIVESYHYLMKKLGGLAVARLEDEICGVCGIEVTSQRQQLARAGQEVYCDGCGRLLVV